MVTRRAERRREASEHAAAVMRNRRRLAVHQPATHHAPTEMLADRLMPPAYAAQRPLGVGARRDEVEAEPRLVGGARAGRDQERARAARPRLAAGQRVG